MQKKRKKKNCWNWREFSFDTLWTHTQSIENQNENKLIKTESNIITQWNVKYKTAKTRQKERKYVCVCALVCLREWAREKNTETYQRIKKKIIIRKTTHNRITHKRTRGLFNVYENTHTQQRHYNIYTQCASYLTLHMRWFHLYATQLPLSLSLPLRNTHPNNSY